MILEKHYKYLDVVEESFEEVGNAFVSLWNTRAATLRLVAYKAED